MAQFEATLNVWNKTVSDFLDMQGINGADYQDAEGYAITETREITDEMLDEIIQLVGNRMEAINEVSRQVAGIDIDAGFSCEVSSGASVIVTITDNQDATADRVRALNKLIVFDPVTGTGLDGAMFGIGQGIMETVYQVSCCGLEVIE